MNKSETATAEIPWHEILYPGSRHLSTGYPITAEGIRDAIATHPESSDAILKARQYAVARKVFQNIERDVYPSAEQVEYMRSAVQSALDVAGITQVEVLDIDFSAQFSEPVAVELEAKKRALEMHKESIEKYRVQIGQPDTLTVAMSKIIREIERYTSHIAILRGESSS